MKTEGWNFGEIFKGAFETVIRYLVPKYKRRDFFLSSKSFKMILRDTHKNI